SLLTHATLDSLAQAVKEFTPTVVHIVCHGDIADVGKQELSPALEFRAKEGSDASIFVDAEKLLANLTIAPGVPHPPAVVLNACSTATSDELRVGRPFAAELVQSGIPVVVGMSGPVSDQACRLFTAGFYSALLESGSVAEAAARGRRAALAH